MRRYCTNCRERLTLPSRFRRLCPTCRRPFNRGALVASLVYLVATLVKLLISFGGPQ
jgi:uncharacterized CHY-type Zn-finger protein